MKACTSATGRERPPANGCCADTWGGMPMRPRQSGPRTKRGHPQRHRDTAMMQDDPHEATRRRRSSANRTLVTLKAALSRAWRERKVLSDEAWRSVRPFQGADAARVRYLTIEECRR